MPVTQGRCKVQRCSRVNHPGPRSLSGIDSVGWLGLEWQARRCRNVRIALLFGASLRLDPAIRSTSPASVAYLRQAPSGASRGFQQVLIVALVKAPQLATTQGDKDHAVVCNNPTNGW